MKSTPRRTIKEVFFDGIGPLSAQDLLGMPRNRWEGLRGQITDHHNGKDGTDARCMACDGQVYISTAKGHPFFGHYSGSDTNCPWYTGKNIRPDDARAAQYQGKQESEAHRRMCELIAELAGLDTRFINSEVDHYLPPTNNENGRYPDVLIEWGGFGRFVVEFQLSHTFQTEVSQRGIHYDREGIPLLWVLASFDPSRVPQPVSDILHRHRGNAFVLDMAAIKESRRQRTLVLTCYLSNGDGYDAPVLTRYDALTIPDNHIPYLEDRIVTPLITEIRERRIPYVFALRDWGDRTGDLPIPVLEGFDRRKVDRLIAASFSIVAEANGRPENFASDHPTIVGMLNTYLNSKTLSSYAHLLTALIQNTAQRDLLKGTVGRHLQRAIDRPIKQVDEASPEWQLLKCLLPEALDPFIRNQLQYLGALPTWAR